MFQALKQQASDAIRQSYKLLSTEQNLSPHNESVTASLTRLVHTLTHCQSPELVEFLMGADDLKEEREKLPALCGIAECEMEKYWAQKLIARPVCDLSEFWYFPQYMALCRAEIDLFKEKAFSRISFLGSGALPLTAFLLAQNCPQIKIACVDCDAVACDLSEQLSRKTGLGNHVNIHHMNAQEYTPEENELVICASLLQGREQLYQRFTDHDCALVVRDAEGAYQYLYKAAELPKSSFREVSKTVVDAQRINTSRYYERDHGVLSHAL